MRLIWKKERFLLVPRKEPRIKHRSFIKDTWLCINADASTTSISHIRMDRLRLSHGMIEIMNSQKLVIATATLRIWQNRETWKGECKKEIDFRFSTTKHQIRAPTSTCFLDRVSQSRQQQGAATGTNSLSFAVRLNHCQTGKQTFPKVVPQADNKITVGVMENIRKLLHVMPPPCDI
jgi:hypothetical protein